MSASTVEEELVDALKRVAELEAERADIWANYRNSMVERDQIIGKLEAALREIAGITSAPGTVAWVIADQARTALADSGPAWVSPLEVAQIENDREEILCERDALRAELKEEQEEYEALTGLLKRRFPQNPDGSLPDFAIEDVLRENERMKPVVEAVCDWRDMGLGEMKVRAAVDAFRVDAFRAGSKP
jgi:hypothetical protein